MFQTHLTYIKFAYSQSAPRLEWLTTGPLRIIFPFVAIRRDVHCCTKQCEEALSYIT